MTHYSDNPGSVRVSLFKPSGKWYACGAVDMSGHYEGVDLHDGLYAACTRTHEAGNGGWPVMSSPYAWLIHGGTVVCLEPYHEHAHPVMLTQAQAERAPFAEGGK